MQKKLYLLALAGLLVASSAQAQIDQVNYIDDGWLSYAHEANGQTFTPSWTSSRGAGLYLTGGGGYATVATLFVQLRTSPGGTLLASGSTSFTLTPGQDAWVDAFWAPVSVTPGNSYFLAFATDDPYEVITHYSAYPDQYGGGGWFYNGNTDINGPYTDYTAYSYDMVFHEYASEVAVVTPEPASIVLLATGLAGVFGFARRRNKKAA